MTIVPTRLPRSVQTDQIDQEEPNMRTAIHTPDAPAAIGTYSQAIRAGDTVCKASLVSTG